MIELKHITKTFNAGKTNEFTAIEDVDRIVDAIFGGVEAHCSE